MYFAESFIILASLSIIRCRTLTSISCYWYGNNIPWTWTLMISTGYPCTYAYRTHVYSSYCTKILRQYDSHILRIYFWCIPLPYIPSSIGFLHALRGYSLFGVEDPLLLSLREVDDEQLGDRPRSRVSLDASRDCLGFQLSHSGRISHFGRSNK